MFQMCLTKTENHHFPPCYKFKQMRYILKKQNFKKTTEKDQQVIIGASIFNKTHVLRVNTINHIIFSFHPRRRMVSYL